MSDFFASFRRGRGVANQSGVIDRRFFIVARNINLVFHSRYSYTERVALSVDDDEIASSSSSSSYKYEL